MKIHGICLIKNEADIVEYSLTEATKWCDNIYVFDNGSTDGTWEIVRELSKQHSAIVPFCRDERLYSNALRGEVFRATRDKAQAGDWWCRLDADEIYIDSPREFLSQVPSLYQVVWAIKLQYYLQEPDLNRFTPEDFERPPVMTAENLPRHYASNDSEERFFRHRSRLQWHEDSSWPDHMGVVYPRRLRLKHFQNRSPAQVQSRLDLRHQAKSLGTTSFLHVKAKEWEDTLARDTLYLDENNGQYSIDNRVPNHLDSMSMRLIKLFMHGTKIWP